MVRGGRNHESREINEVFHDSRKFLKVSRKISAGWNDYRAVGTKCSDRMSGSKKCGTKNLDEDCVR